MTYRQVLGALNEKKAIISRTDDDHWLYEPISEAINLIEESAHIKRELEVYKKALKLACINASERECLAGCRDCKIGNEYISCYDWENLRDAFLQKARS